MGIKEKNTDQMRQSRIITLSEFYGANSEDNSDASGSQEGFGAGEPILTEISTSMVGGGFVGAAGDMWATIDFQTPRLCNPDEEIGVRVHYMSTSGAAVGTDDITWIVKYDVFNHDEAMGNTPAEDLDTAIGEHRPGAGIATARTLARTARGVINASSFTWANRSAGIMWRVEADAMDFATNELAFLGLEIDYVPKWCKDGNEDVEYFKNLAATS